MGSDHAGDDFEDDDVSYDADSYLSRPGSESTLEIEHSRLTRSRTSSQDYVMRTHVPLWCKQARALGYLQSVVISTIALEPGQRKRSTVYYILDVFYALPQLGSVRSFQQCVEPQYQLRRRFSDCFDLRRRLLEICAPSDHRHVCDYCKGLHHALKATRFPSRWPRAWDVLACWHSTLLRKRQEGLQSWLNRLLTTTHKTVTPVGACEASLLVLHELSMFFLESPPTDSDR
ncbi:hypothetical protein SPRG_03026 [Saprolegnia parasitica CBS 223.65]|uniref:PX domain-containing protein n=1 Tax=Saprolegnia parasitica (strain CBS 223.65) TaxID=695850 RepID=A0A067D199_SAPPC|nr:hypothetical protein SPRG_03026 [Saprolegnia parasitica CBS 223.65]KDO32551.1 hypothetical protein SPRG_03026 [Saprolegnia parasitica CBS 223.65]|eukprot:XP_012196997.1 hypothetical protein SPRG_03026 [Saprolegnia parasitica CBS 223.65]